MFQDDHVQVDDHGDPRCWYCGSRGFTGDQSDAVTRAALGAAVAGTAGAVLGAASAGSGLRCIACGKVNRPSSHPARYSGVPYMEVERQRKAEEQAAAAERRAEKRAAKAEKQARKRAELFAETGIDPTDYPRTQDAERAAIRARSEQRRAAHEAAQAHKREARAAAQAAHEEQRAQKRAAHEAAQAHEREARAAAQAARQEQRAQKRATKQRSKAEPAISDQDGTGGPETDPPAPPVHEPELAPTPTAPRKPTWTERMEASTARSNERAERYRAESKAISERGRQQRAAIRARGAEQRAAIKARRTQQRAARAAARERKQEARAAARAGRIGHSSPPPAGWYPDPSGLAPLRWWDGRQWTAATETAPR